MKNFKKILCLVFAAVFVLQLSACTNNKNTSDQKDKQETKAEKKINYTESWLLSPSIQAEAIYSLPIVKFNESTSHYEITYGENFVIKKDGKYGLIDSNGKLVLEPQFDSIETCPCYEGYIATVKEGEYYTTTYHVDMNNQKLWTYSHACEGFNGYAFRWDKTASSVKSVNIDGENTYPAGLTPVLPETMQISENEALTEKYALVVSGKAVSTDEYTGAGVFTGGVAAVCNESGKWGYISSTGKIIIPFQYDAVEGYNALNCQSSTPFECSEGYITVLQNGKYGIYNADGEMVVPCQYPCLTPVHDGRAYASNDGTSWGILIIDEKISNGIKSEEDTTASVSW